MWILFSTFYASIIMVGLLAYTLDRLYWKCVGVELRDAMTGEYLGMTKKQLKRWQYVLGTKNQARIAKEVVAIRRRKFHLSQFGQS